jgi:hypothetical protein
MKSAVTQNGVGAKSNVHVELNVVCSCHFGDVIQDLYGTFCSTEFLGVRVYNRGWGANWSRWV